MNLSWWMASLYRGLFLALPTRGTSFEPCRYQPSWFQCPLIQIKTYNEELLIDAKVASSTSVSTRRDRTTAYSEFLKASGQYQSHMSSQSISGPHAQLSCRVNKFGTKFKRVMVVPLGTWLFRGQWGQVQGVKAFWICYRRLLAS